MKYKLILCHNQTTQPLYTNNKKFKIGKHLTSDIRLLLENVNDIHLIIDFENKKLEALGDCIKVNAQCINKGQIRNFKDGDKIELFGVTLFMDNFIDDIVVNSINSNDSITCRNDSFFKVTNKIEFNKVNNERKVINEGKVNNTNDINNEVKVNNTNDINNEGKVNNTNDINNEGKVNNTIDINNNDNNDFKKVDNSNLDNFNNTNEFNNNVNYNNYNNDINNTEFNTEIENITSSLSHTSNEFQNNKLNCHETNLICQKNKYKKENIEEQEMKGKNKMVKKEIKEQEMKGKNKMAKKEIKDHDNKNEDHDNKIENTKKEIEDRDNKIEFEEVSKINITGIDKSSENDLKNDFNDNLYNDLKNDFKNDFNENFNNDLKREIAEFVNEEFKTEMTSIKRIENNKNALTSTIIDDLKTQIEHNDIEVEPPEKRDLHDIVVDKNICQKTKDLVGNEVIEEIIETREYEVTTIREFSSDQKINTNDYNRNYNINNSNYDDNPNKTTNYDDNPNTTTNYDDNPNKTPNYDENPNKTTNYDENPNKTPNYDDNPNKTTNYDDNPYKIPNYDDNTFNTPDNINSSTMDNIFKDNKPSYISDNSILKGSILSEDIEDEIKETEKAIQRTSDKINELNESFKKEVIENIEPSIEESGIKIIEVGSDEFKDGENEVKYENNEEAKNDEEDDIKKDEAMNDGVHDAKNDGDDDIKNDGDDDVKNDDGKNDGDDDIKKDGAKKDGAKKDEKVIIEENREEAKDNDKNDLIQDKMKRESNTINTPKKRGRKSKAEKEKNLQKEIESNKNKKEVKGEEEKELKVVDEKELKGEEERELKGEEEKGVDEKEVKGVDEKKLKGEEERELKGEKQKEVEGEELKYDDEKLDEQKKVASERRDEITNENLKSNKRGRPKGSTANKKRKTPNASTKKKNKRI
ncbi:hypothetical protein DMUE_3441 [Dictyocoela muelleri]|nr:hypothetical protein DMUE_3441 [Dictyocoela muelleri]